ncbi:MAG: prolipoprotein diacylglyceryl transferase [Desulfobulbaceae bacterium A2]|nr:MAG: prolipoprotein diacylglyceryl transferase [Desulfobulbaceae bacterium A2]
MFNYPEIDPVIFGFGPLQVRWYGLMYVLGFAATYLLVRRQIREFGQHLLERRFDDLNTALILGVILGGRLGYVFFYHPGYFLQHPLEIPAIWQGGMSFHGACLGVMLAGYLACRRFGLDFWAAADIYVVTIPIGLGLGRIGNFINGELFGRVSAVSWAMIFPQGGPWPRHPSQLYEAVLEGILLFLLLWLCRQRPWQREQTFWPHGSLLALFLAAYALVRFLVEFTREPDPHLGLLAAGLSLGQWLSLAMFAGGLLLWYWRGKRQRDGR